MKSSILKKIIIAVVAALITVTTGITLVTAIYADDNSASQQVATTATEGTISMTELCKTYTDLYDVTQYARYVHYETILAADYFYSSLGNQIGSGAYTFKGLATYFINKYENNTVFTISNAFELDLFRQLINYRNVDNEVVIDFYGKTVELLQDIDLSTYKLYDPDTQNLKSSDSVNLIGKQEYYPLESGNYNMYAVLNHYKEILQKGNRGNNPLNSGGGGWPDFANMSVEFYWTPIGWKKNKSERKFRGTFEGNYHTISNVKIDTADANKGSNQGGMPPKNIASIYSAKYVDDNYAAVGFFGCVQQATINNLRLCNMEISLNGQFNANNENVESASVGCLVGTILPNDGSVQKSCSINGCVVSNSNIKINDTFGTYTGKTKVRYAAGGLVGSSSPNSSIKEYCAYIYKCSVDCNLNANRVFVSSESDSSIFVYVGGIVGYWHDNEDFPSTNSITCSVYHGSLNYYNDAEIAHSDYGNFDVNTYSSCYSMVKQNIPSIKQCNRAKVGTEPNQSYFNETEQDTYDINFSSWTVKEILMGDSRAADGVKYGLYWYIPRNQNFNNGVPIPLEYLVGYVNYDVSPKQAWYSLEELEYDQNHHYLANQSTGTETPIPLYYVYRETGVLLTNKDLLTGFSKDYSAVGDCYKPSSGTETETRYLVPVDEAAVIYYSTDINTTKRQLAEEVYINEFKQSEGRKAEFYKYSFEVFDPSVKSLGIKTSFNSSIDIYLEREELIENSLNINFQGALVTTPTGENYFVRYDGMDKYFEGGVTQIPYSNLTDEMFNDVKLREGSAGIRIYQIDGINWTQSFWYEKRGEAESLKIEKITKNNKNNVYRIVGPEYGDISVVGEGEIGTIENVELAFYYGRSPKFANSGRIDGFDGLYYVQDEQDSSDTCTGINSYNYLFIYLKIDLEEQGLKNVPVDWVFNKKQGGSGILNGWGFKYENEVDNANSGIYFNRQELRFEFSYADWVVNMLESSNVFEDKNYQFMHDLNLKVVDNTANLDTGNYDYLIYPKGYYLVAAEDFVQDKTSKALFKEQPRYPYYGYKYNNATNSYDYGQRIYDDNKETSYETRSFPANSDTYFGTLFSDFWGLCTDSTVWSNYGFVLELKDRVMGLDGDTSNYISMDYYVLYKRGSDGKYNESSPKLYFGVDPNTTYKVEVDNKEYTYVKIVDKNLPIEVQVGPNIFKKGEKNIGGLMMFEGEVLDQNLLLLINKKFDVSIISNIGIPTMEECGAKVPCILDCTPPVEVIPLTISDLKYNINPKFNEDGTNQNKQYFYNLDGETITFATKTFDAVVGQKIIFSTTNSSCYLQVQVVIDNKRVDLKIYNYAFDLLNSYNYLPTNTKEGAQLIMDAYGYFWRKQGEETDLQNNTEITQPLTLNLNLEISKLKFNILTALMQQDEGRTATRKDGLFNIVQRTDAGTGWIDYSLLEKFVFPTSVINIAADKLGEFYTIEISLPENFAAWLGEGTEEFNYKFIVANSYTAARQALNSAKTTDAICIIPKNGYAHFNLPLDLAALNLCYIYNLEAEQEFNFNDLPKFDYTNQPALTIKISKEQESFNLIFGAELQSYSMPFYWQEIAKQDETPGQQTRLNSGGTAPETEEKVVYKVLNKTFDINHGIDFAQVLEEVKQLFGETNYEVYVGWVITSNKEALLAQNFSHILNGGKIEEIVTLEQNVIDGIFQTNKNITLYSGSGYKENENYDLLDLNKFEFVLASNVAEKDVFTVGDNCKYYSVAQLVQGSYGNIEELQIEVDKQNPYIKIRIATITLTISDLKYNINPKFNEDEANKNKQYFYNLDGETITFATKTFDVVMGQKIIFSTTNSSCYLQVQVLIDNKCVDLKIYNYAFDLLNSYNYLPTNTKEGAQLIMDAYGYFWRVQGKEEIDLQNNTEITQPLTLNLNLEISKLKFNILTALMQQDEEGTTATKEDELFNIVQRTDAGTGWMDYSLLEKFVFPTSVINIAADELGEFYTIEISLPENFAAWLGEGTEEFNYKFIVANSYTAARQALNSAETTDAICIIPKNGYAHFNLPLDLATLNLFYIYNLEAEQEFNFNDLPKFDYTNQPALTIKISKEQESFNLIFGAELQSYSMPFYWQEVAKQDETLQQVEPEQQTRLNSGKKLAVDETLGGGTAPETEEKVVYKVLNKTFDVNHGIDFAQVLEEVKQLFGETDYEVYNGWVITSNKEALLAQNFSHILNGGKIEEIETLEQNVIDGIFQTNKNITLYSGSGYKENENYDLLDLNKFEFVLASNVAEKDVFTVGDNCKYYSVAQLVQGSYGNIEELQIEVDKQNPYIKIRLATATLTILNGEFAYQTPTSRAVVNIKSPNQYFDGENWYGSETPVYELKPVTIGQTLTYSSANGLKLIGPGGLGQFEFAVAVPYNNDKGYIFTNDPLFANYYTVTWILTSNGKTYELEEPKPEIEEGEEGEEGEETEDNGGTIVAQDLKFVITHSTTMKLRFAPIEYLQTIEVVTTEEQDGQSKIIEQFGGNISDEQYKVGERRTLTFVAFAGSIVRLNNVKLQGKYFEFDNYNELIISAPEYLKGLINVISVDREFVFSIIPKVSTHAILNEEFAQYFVAPDRGYQLNNADGTAVSYSVLEDEFIPMEVTAVDTLEKDCLNVASKMTYHVDFVKQHYELPVYYRNVNNLDNPNYVYNTYPFDIDTEIDFSAINEPNASLTGQVDGWMLSSNIADLRTQFDAIDIGRAGLSWLNILTQEDISQVLNSGSMGNRRVTFISNRTDAVDDSELFGSIIDADYYTFTLGEKIYTIFGTFYKIEKLEKGSNGNLQILTNLTDDIGKAGPYIRPYIKKEYALTIQNVLNNAEDGFAPTSIHANADENVTLQYFGVGGTSAFVVNNTLVKDKVFITEQNNGKANYGPTLQFKVSNAETSSYKFFNNNLTKGYYTAFYLPNDFANTYNSTTSRIGDNYYYLYNYGYEIYAWKVIMKVKNNLYDLYIGLDENYGIEKWVWKAHTAQGVPTDVSNSLLNNLAECLNDVKDFSAFTADMPEILLIPLWQATTIKPISQNKQLGTPATFSYGYDYDFSKSNTLTLPAGQTLAYFLPVAGAEVNKQSLIINGKLAEGIKWNYRNIPYKFYSYEDGAYIINLQPQCLDNIYKIELLSNKLKTYKDTDGIEKFVISGGDYALIQTTPDFDAKQYIYSDAAIYAGMDFEFVAYSTYKAAHTDLYWTEEYSSELNTFVVNYNAAIAGSKNSKMLPMLRKVYFADVQNLTFGTTSVTVDEQEKSYTSFTGASPMYIYLVNNQQVGLLPSLLDEYYQLILWHNSGLDDKGAISEFAYVTDVYSAALHEVAIKENAFKQTEIWQYMQCYNVGVGYNQVLNPYYFRKYFYLNPQTIIEQPRTVGQFGYALIRVEDVLEDKEDNVSINYLVIFLDNKMMFYTFPAIEQWQGENMLLFHTYTTGQMGNSNLINTDLLTPVEKVKFYAGCDIHFVGFDQSRDPTAMASGLYDDMIGNKFASVVWYSVTGLPLFSTKDSETVQYSSMVPEQDILDFNLAVGNSYTVNIIFERINYNFAVSMADELAGSFSLYLNGRAYTQQPQTHIEEVPIVVSNIFAINYLAKLGYEFQEHAYTLTITIGENSYTLLLANYEELIAPDGTINQTYLLNLTGTWLRQHFYCAKTVENVAILGNQDFALEKTDLGTVFINTVKITFDYNIKVYDSSKTGEEAWLDQIEVGKWNVENTNVSLADALKLIKNNKYYGYYVGEGEDKVEYAAVSAFSYIANNPISKKNNLVNYPFPLLASSNLKTQEFNIYPYLTENLGINANDIAPLNNRTIFAVLEVRPMLTIQVFVRQLEHDTNSTNRQITISNSQTNMQTFTIGGGATVQDGYYYTSPPNALIEVDSYVGLFNEITTVYDAKRYTGMQMSLNGIETTQTRFAVDQDSVVEIAFVPSALNVNVKYYLNDVETSLQNLTQITNCSIAPLEALFMGDTIDISVAIAADYQGRININGVDCVPLFIGSTSYVKTVSDYDYDFGAINISIFVEEQPNRSIAVKLQVKDGSKAYSGDNIGTLTIVVGNDEYSGNSNVNVYENRQVAVKVNLNAGFTYAGQIYFAGREINRAMSGNTIQLISSFRVEKDANGDPVRYPDAGTYIIYVNKINIRLEFENNEGEIYYNMNSNAVGAQKSSTNNNQKITIENAYVNSTVNFVARSTSNRFELDHFYYTNAKGNRVNIAGSSIAISSSVIEDAGTTIRFGVVNKQKFRLNLSIESDYPGLEQFALYSTNQPDFVSGNYYLKNTQFNFSFFGAELGKYKVTLYANGAVVATADEFGYTNYEFSLTQDTTLLAKIAPTEFNISSTEFHCNTLSDLENPTQAQVGSGQNLGTLPNSALFNHQVRLDVLMENENWLLYKFELETIKGAKLVVEIDNGQIVVKFNDMVLREENGSYNITVDGEIYSYTIQLDGNFVVIGYTQIEDVSINLFYKNYKLIQKES